MRYIFLLLVIVTIGCETHSFDSDKRQLIAKDQIKKQLRKARSFDVVSFSQDTLDTHTNTFAKKSLRYQLDFVYTDSLGRMQRKKGEVLFTPDGKSVIDTRIN